MPVIKGRHNRNHQMENVMEQCIKTDAYVYIPCYGVFEAADIFAVGDKRVIQLHPNFGARFNGNELRDPTHTLDLNSRKNYNYWNKERGIAVVESEDLVPFQRSDVVETLDL